MKADTLEKVLATLKTDKFGALEASIYFAKFDLNVRLVADKQLDTYEKRCIETFFAWGETLFTKLEQASFEYYQGHLDNIGEEVEFSSTQIWNHCQPMNIHFISSQKDLFSTFIDVELECDWEIEHGMQWLIKNTDELVFVGPYNGHADPDCKLDLTWWNFA
ncbi:DUF6985 domain-containing protein [Nostoc sp. DSM 114161]|jgi:hypothetical protein|uniref:DUF6985 domain-containing protein n=1 Tax=Nostoc sp. DSM 114161 TaxID=3440143 RepID=UPI00404547C6